MLLGLLYLAAFTAIFGLVGLLTAVWLVRWFFFLEKSLPQKATVAFFHPYCAAGGGGERVLWCAIASLAGTRHDKQLQIVIYSGEPEAEGPRILQNARKTFNLDIPDTLEIRFVHLPNRHLLETAKRYPVTMVCESVASIVVAWTALRKFNPDVFIDTTGYAFTFIVAKLLAGCRVGCYVHYPTITTDMMSKVVERRPDYNNNTAVTNSTTLTAAKLYYYKLFAFLYSIMGAMADVVMVNSSWTKGHIDALWSLPSDSSSELGEEMDTTSIATTLAKCIGWDKRRPVAKLVFPPCNTTHLSHLNLGGRDNIIISLAQFRPEKDHELQIRAFTLFKAKHAEIAEGVKLVLIGGARNADDSARVIRLREFARSSGLTEGADVEFRVNAPFEEVQGWLARARAGLHTMWNEHFGIGVVEMMAAGVCVVAHNSGGPKADIVAPAVTGFLAATPEEYADALAQIFGGGVNVAAVTSAARKSVKRFSDDEFSLTFFAAIVRCINAAVRDAAARAKVL